MLIMFKCNIALHNTKGDELNTGHPVNSQWTTHKELMNVTELFNVL